MDEQDDKFAEGFGIEDEHGDVEKHIPDDVGEEDEVSLDALAEEEHAEEDEELDA